MDPFAAACRAVPGVPVPELAPAVATARPHGDAQWVPAGELEHPAVLSSLLTAARGDAAAGNAVGAAVALAQGLTYTLAGPSLAGSAAAGLVLELDPAYTWLGFGARGFCERLAVRPLTIVPAAGGFEDRLARPVVAVLEPAFEQVHRLTRIGRRVLWAAVADSVHQIMLGTVVARAGAWRGEQLRTALDDAWERAAAVVDALAARAAAPLPRPRPFPVADQTFAATWLVRGGCCFVYQEGGDYCVTCPIIDDDVRRARLLRWLRGIAAPG
ncbi:(2Fe-2S)-binding protein [Jiangella gansuensis]|uniref:(2Fe-2S)-binding protein n=1 Tax=Jiangella gansuensis TaxID=281473 RepID=UPI0004AC7735|nr:(2Fe-2S)-binding protein [Jiangella gansuensis]